MYALFGNFHISLVFNASAFGEVCNLNYVTHLKVSRNMNNTYINRLEHISQVCMSFFK